MNHATTLRHSRAHRDAAKRNARAIAAHFITRVTLETDERSAFNLVRYGLPRGVCVIGQSLTNYERSALLVIDIEPGCGAMFYGGDHIKIIKQERIRK